MQGGSVELLGREDELSALAAFVDGAPRALAIVGEPGIGKTALWRHAVALARTRGFTVLTAEPSEPEAQLPFAALGDLVGAVADDVLPALAPPRRQALEAALVLADVAAPSRHAIALGCLDALAALPRPLLVAIDDVQWLDGPSAVAVGYALRRLDAHVLLARRVADPLPAPLAALALDRLDVGPLSLGALHRLVADRLDIRLPRPRLRRIHERAHGNPLHALELARRVASDTWLSTPDAFALPPDVSDLVEARLAELPGPTRTALLYATAVSRPTLDLLQRLLPGASEALRAADDFVAIGDERRIRFRHPLYASACYRSATIDERRAAHRVLAGAIDVPEERARHLGLAAEGPDEPTAAALDDGARHARTHGAPDVAAELAERARQLTPATDAGARARRAIAAAHYLLEAGEARLARTTLELELAGAEGAVRSRLLTALAEIAYEEEGTNAAAGLARQALAAAGDDPEAQLGAHLVLGGHSDLPAADRLVHVEEALRLVRIVPGAKEEARALRDRAVMMFHWGRPFPDADLERAHELEQQSSDLPPVAWRARTVQGECVKYLDRFEEARALLAEALAIADAEGDESSRAEILGHHAELLVWLGEWDDADRLANEAVAATEATEQRGRLTLALYFRSLVRAHRGAVEQARADATAVVDLSRESGYQWAEAHGWWMLGFLALSSEDFAAAAAALRRADDLFCRDVLSETRQWRYLADAVEAFAAAGEEELARTRLERLERWAESLGTAVPRALAARARGDAAESVRLFDALGMPFEAARSRFALGGAQRRQRTLREARETLTTARDAFARVGAPLWVARAEAELARIGGRAAQPGALTPSERRVAELVASGRSNKEIAAALVVTPRTVEAHLTRIYAKLGVRSRTELAARL